MAPRQRPEQPSGTARLAWAGVIVFLLILLAGVLLYIFTRPPQSAPDNPSASTQHAPAPPVVIVSPHMLLGNPSQATADPSNKNNFLMVKPYFCLSYNDSKGTPNWVSWRLTSADLGTAPRKQTFDPDDSLPVGFYRVEHRDYVRCGFDRGHMCPHSDRGANQEMAFGTFVLTNIIPQAPNVNRKAWERLEAYGRDLALQHNHLYIVSGPAGQGGVGTDGPASTIAGGRIVVPAECWKIIVVVPEGVTDDLAAINAGTRAISVIMPNTQDVGEDWRPFLTTIAEVEKHTGLHFLTNLPGDVAETLRRKLDTGGH